MIRRAYSYFVVSIILFAGSLAQAGSPVASAAQGKATASDANARAGVLLAANINDGSRQIAKAQRLLARLGYRPGGADGIPGPSTRRAIRRFQERQSLPVNGRVTPGLIAELQRAATRERRNASPAMAKLKAWIEQNTARASEFHEQNQKIHAQLSARCAASRDDWIRNSDGAWIDCSELN